ncbi:hypothetical protein [Phytobacter ursingii]|uniref:Uncharacterized protein n=1 Tax=Phytobacter ursingii TaxID=1972431 RepID=A0AB35RLM5_9ENTR|nr:hypothetical protein [Phytobacter ursingii]MDV2861866.1 hypothetical protein [Phytobacter ursingii]
MKVAIVYQGRCIQIYEDNTGQTIDELSLSNPAVTFVDVDLIAAAINDYYNPADGFFYVDTDFTHLSGWTPPVLVSDVLPVVLQQLASNAEWYCNAALVVPYNFERGSSWDTQVMEARAWTADNSYVPVLLNAMVAHSNGGWTLPELAANIISNDDGWKEAIGNVLGQVKEKRMALTALVAQVNAGTADVSAITNFDTNLVLPDFVPVDKYA